MSGSTTTLSISIIVPVYNEARYVEQVLRKVRDLQPRAELIVVDDGSVDESPAILQRLAAPLQLQVVTHPGNRGKGAAIRSGVEASRGDVLVIQDADLEYDPEDYPVLLKPLLEQRADIVYGSRFLGPHRASYFWHRFGNWVITTLVNVFFNASLTDVETGYKAFRRSVVDRLTWRARGFEFEVEFTCKILRQGQTLFEVPVSYYGRSYAEGKKITWKDGVHALWVILCCRVNPRY